MKKLFCVFCLLACIPLLFSAAASADDADTVRIQDLREASDDELAEALLIIETEMRARIRTHIELDKQELKLVKGKGDVLVPELRDSEEGITTGSYTWTSSDETVATVSAKGQVRGISTGNAVITCSALLSSGFEIKADCPVQVYIPVNAVTANPKALTMARGSQTEIRCTVTPADATEQSLTFTCSDETVAAVSADGTVTALETGDCVVTAAALDGSGKKLDIKVSVRQEVQSISLEMPGENVAAGKTAQLKGTVFPENANNKQLVWSSSDETVATVDAKGKVTGIAPGTVRITAAAADGAGAEASLEVQVVQPMKSIAVEDNPVILALYTDWKQKASTEPDNTTNREILWTSSDESIAAVDADGTITAKGYGVCKVTGTAADGYGARTEIRVEVRSFNYVLRTPEEIDVAFETQGTSSMSMGVTSGGSFALAEERIIDFGNGCVTSLHAKKISPVKPGADQVTVTYVRNGYIASKVIYDVYVAQSAFEDPAQ